MAFSWLRKGLRTGIVTTRYPAARDEMPKDFRGKPVLHHGRCLAEQGCEACVQVCVPGALRISQEISATIDEAGRSKRLTLDLARCIMCGLCVDACPTGALRMTEEYELAASDLESLRVTALFATTQESE
jgi:hydrogenase-4 component H